MTDGRPTRSASWSSETGRWPARPNTSAIRLSRGLRVLNGSSGCAETLLVGPLLTDDSCAQLSSCPRKRAPRGGQHCVCGPGPPLSRGRRKKRTGPICLVRTTGRHKDGHPLLSRAELPVDTVSLARYL